MVNKSTRKRGKRKEQRRQPKKQRRVLVYGIVIVGALLVAFALIYPNLKNAGDVVTVDTKSRPQVSGTSMGDPNAPVKIDIFEDFQCLSCRAYTVETEPGIIDTYVATGKAYYMFHQFPFLDARSITKESQQSANASMCAAEQNKFWDYHDMLFANWNGENAGTFRDERLITFAETIGLDMNAFQKCFSENRYQEEIKADYLLGASWGVQGTPSIFVNEVQVNPDAFPTFDIVKQAVDAALAASGQ